ncbi:MAG: YbjN domain-containing protein, partial [Aestuariivirgaceae bacterium]
VEELAASHNWFVERAADDEINMVVEGTWSDLHICLNWRDDIEGLHMACTFDLKVPEPRREEVRRVTALINEQLYFGHFDIWPSEGTLMFRNGLLLTGGAQASNAQYEALISLALETSERYFPVFQFVIWAGKSAEQAMELSLLETLGEA